MYETRLGELTNIVTRYISKIKEFILTKLFLNS